MYIPAQATCARQVLPFNPIKQLSTSKPHTDKPVCVLIQVSI